MSKKKPLKNNTPDSINIEVVNDEEVLDEEQTKALLAAKFESITHSGPIPPPQFLEKYDKIVPGSAEKIMDMAFKEQNHRHTCNDKLIDGEFTLRKLGMIFGFIITTGAFVFGTYLISQGYSVEGTIFGSIVLIGLVRVFINGKSLIKSDEKEADDTSAHNDESAGAQEKK